VKARLALQLETSLRQRDATLVASLFAVMRSEPERAARTAWQLCLDGAKPDLEPLGRRVLLREIDAALAAATVPLPEATAQAQRVAALLGQMRRPEARPALRRLALHPAIEVRTAAARGLLSLGDDARAVASLAGADAASAALATPAPPPDRHAILR
jgi:HEAT repeat protein